MTKRTAQNIHTVSLLQLTITQRTAQNIYIDKLLQIEADNNDTTYCTEHT